MNYPLQTFPPIKSESDGAAGYLKDNILMVSERRSVNLINPYIPKLRDIGIRSIYS
jgi:hypothetical protein